MRVKKLNAATRRPRAGEDDAAGLGGDSSSPSPTSPSPSTSSSALDASHSPQSPSPASQWISPTKSSPTPASSSLTPGSLRCVDVIEICADSPTDPTAAPPVQPHDVSELDLNRPYLSAFDMANAPATTKSTSSGAPAGATTPATNGASVRPGNPASSSISHATAAMTTTTTTTLTSTTAWRENVGRAHRENIHQKIVEYLSTLKPNAPAKVREKLPGLAYRMEEALFKMATSEAEYSDQATLPQRLTLIQQANARRLLQQQCPRTSPKDKGNAASATAAGTAAARANRSPLNEEQARVVFSCLQSWRQKLVNMYSATPWEILPNKILAKVAVFIPSTTQELVVCGVANEQLERFGNSLLQEIEKVMNALNANASAAAAAQQMQAAMNAAGMPSPSGTKRPSSSGAKMSSNPSTARGRASAADQAANKKRKTAAAVEPAPTSSSAPLAAVRLAAATTPSFLTPASFLAPSPTLIRPMDPAFLAAAAAASSLPALLPTGANAGANGKKTSAATPPPFFPRIPAPGLTLDQDNRMHLLAQGVGQLTGQQSDHHQQQQQQRQLDAEKEIQALRWLLQETQREKALLEAEVQRLRQQGAK